MHVNVDRDMHVGEACVWKGRHACGQLAARQATAMLTTSTSWGMRYVGFIGTCSLY